MLVPCLSAFCNQTLRLACISLLLGLGFSAAAQESPLLLREMEDFRQFSLPDGREGALAGLFIPKDTAISAETFAELTTALPLTFRPSRTSPDRHGHLPGQLYDADGRWIQAALVERGLAIIYDAETDPAILQELLALEAQARRARLGLWQEERWQPVAAGRAHTRRQQFAIVEGEVRSVATIRGVTYLNFGADWRSDFTARIPKGFKRTFRNFDAEVLQGEKVRVRGWVFDYNGPMIDVISPALIERLD